MPARTCYTPQVRARILSNWMPSIFNACLWILSRYREKRMRTTANGCGLNKSVVESFEVILLPFPFSECSAPRLTASVVICLYGSLWTQCSRSGLFNSAGYVRDQVSGTRG